jgi:transglutaminase-like putative cysteine protease
MSESLTLRFFKLILYEIGVILVASEMTGGAGMFGAALAAPLAFFLAPKILQLPTKRLVTFGLLALFMMSATLVYPLFLNEQILPAIIGVGNTFTLADFFGGAAVAFASILLLRCLIIVYPSLSFVEAGILLAFFAWKLSVHRDLALHRPQGLADYAWDHGTNPVVILMLLGTLLFAFAATLALRTRRLGQTLLQIFLILMISFSLFLYYKDRNIKVPEKNNTFGLSGADNPDDYKRGKGDKDGDNKDQNGKDGQKNSSGDSSGSPSSGQSGGKDTGNSSSSSSGHKPPPDEMPFKNDYSQQQNSPAALVNFLTDYTSTDGYYYFRQTAFSAYNGNRLVQAEGTSGETDIVNDLPTTGTTTVPSDKVVLNSAFQEVPTEIFAVFPPTKPFGLANLKTVSRIDNPNSSFFSTAWSATSLAFTQPPWDLAKTHPMIPDWPKAKFAAYTQIPDDARYAKLAHEIIEPFHIDVAKNPLFAMAAISDWLGKNAYYSLKSDHTDAVDPTASFLFGNRTGYCVHFSHAAVYLARALGIPARVGAGYMVPEKRRSNGASLMIMERDAHAWPEIYLKPYGWIIMDVPIQNYLDPPIQEPSQSLQKTLGQMAKNGDGGKRPPEEEEKPQDDLEKKLKEFLHTLLNLIKKLGPPIVLLVIVISYLIKVWRLWGWRFASGRAQLILAYRGVIDRLYDRKLRRALGENREDFAARLKNQLPHLAPLTWEALRATLGKDWQNDEAQLQMTMTAVLAEMKSIPMNAKSVLRMSNPFSWIGRR